MGKRKRKFVQQTNDELFKELEWWVEEIPRNWNHLWTMMRWAQDERWDRQEIEKCIQDAIDESWAALDEISRIHRILEKRLPTDKILVDPVRATKKGHLNLHREDIDYE
jgi:hypothetical protein